MKTKAGKIDSRSITNSRKDTATIFINGKGGNTVLSISGNIEGMNKYINS